jgi:hypothetical protein
LVEGTRRLGVGPDFEALFSEYFDDIRCVLPRLNSNGKPKVGGREPPALGGEALAGAAVLDDPTHPVNGLPMIRQTP